MTLTRPTGSLLTLREADSAEIQGWDGAVRRFANHRATHTRAWVDSLVDAGFGTPLWLRFEREGSLVGCLPGLISRIAGLRLFGSPRVGWQTSSLGPTFDPDAVDTESMLAVLLPFLERQHLVRHMELMHGSLDPDAMRRHGFAEEIVPTFRAPLHPDAPERTLAAMKESARRNVRRAERLGLDVRFGVDPRFIDDHYDQLLDVYHRGGNAITFSRERLGAGIRRLDAAGGLIAVSVFLPESDVRIATGTFTVEGTELLLWNWAHRTHYRWYRATELMTWRVMQLAMRQGCETLDFMGRGDFKAKLGATLDESKRRWIRTTSTVLALGRPVARSVMRARQVVVGRAARVVGRLSARRDDSAEREATPHATVLGDVDLVRALGLRDIRSDVLAPPAAAARFSRHAGSALDWHDPWTEPEGAVQSLLRHSAAQMEPPPLFFQDDASLLLVSRNRERLARAFRFVIGDGAMIERLVDKAQFQALAKEAELPVPLALVLEPASERAPSALPFRGPMILKPITRRPTTWDPIAGGKKALRLDAASDLAALWPLLAESGLRFLVQVMVPGPETGIVSYHVYVDANGHRVADFTGRKLRTSPAEFGDSSALEITDEADVRTLGRELTARLKLRGVAKFDFKRRDDGGLALLEVNPRFTLWHHPAACAGLNIPALVFDDLLGRPRADGALQARAGVHWCKPWTDHAAARAAGIPFPLWLAWAARCEAKRAVAWNDPLPLIRAALATWRERWVTAAPRIA